MISYSGRILNQVQAPAISREQSSLRRNTRAWEWVCALFCLIAMAGCAGLVSQNLPAPSGQLSATPGSVDFGSVEVGVSSTQNITFNNTGSGSLTISQAAVSGAGFTLVGQTFPLTLSAGQSSSVNIQFAPTDTSSTTGSVSLLSSATTLATSVTLKGAGVRHQLSITPSSVGFGNVAVGTANAQTVTLTNSGTANLNISQGSVTGAGFGMSGLTFPFSLAPGQSSAFNAQFVPTAPGNMSGSVSFTSNARNSPTVASLTGSGMLAALSPNPSSFNFGNVLVGSTGAQTITLSNSGTASVTISAASASGTGFSIIGLSVPLTLAAGQNTTFSGQFAPSATGSATGSVSITSNAPGSPLAIALSGTGVQPQLAPTPSSASFGSVVTGTSNSQTIKLSNAGSASVTISQATVSGSGFSITGLAVPLTIAAGSSATFNALFTPSAAGSVTGTVSLVSNAPNSPLVIALSGTGVTATFLLTANPTSLSFGSVNLGSNSSLSTSLTNTGNSNVTLSSVAASGASFSASGVTSGTTLTPNQAVTLSVTFAPASSGSLAGSVSVVSNATNS